jgi:hypothetical protein
MKLELTLGAIVPAMMLIATVQSSAAPPSISAQPQSKTATAPATAMFSVTATGTPPLSYQWKKNGAVISGATSSTYTTPATTTGANGARFTVTVTNGFGSATSNSAILTVYPAATMNQSPVGPILIGGQPQNQDVIAPGTATFSASAIGTEPITYQWKKNGAPISGATSASYTTPATTMADNGASFTVTVANSVNGFTSAPATLTVTSVPVAPTVVAPPSQISVHQGTSALFHVFATGTAPLSYRWRKNGTPISNATDATYQTPLTTAADNNAQFSVIVTNSAGSSPAVAAPLLVSSQAAGLGGFQPLTTLPSIQPGMPNDLVGGQYRFRVVANPSPGLKIIFGFNGLYNPGSANVYDMESNVYSSTLAFADGGCTTWPPLGTNTDSVASLRNATADYPFQSGHQPAVGSAINTSDPVNWPVQTYLVDNIPNLWKSDSISQFNINGIEGLVTIERGDTLTNISSFVRCGLTMLPGTYRMWTITTQLVGHAPVINQLVVPDADARYLAPWEVMQLASEFLSFAGTFTVQYWDFAYMRESNPNWTPVSTFKTNGNYDGSGEDFGIHVVSVGGENRIEFSNVPGNSYLPGGELPFSIATATGPAVVITNPATNVASFSATLNGSLNPQGLTTTVYFQYGTTTSYGSTTAAQSQTGSTYRNISTSISGLNVSTTYHFRIVASNSAGTTFGSDRTFTSLTATGLPVVTTNPATLIASFSTTLNGSLDPHGLTTNVYFQYGTTTSYGSTTVMQNQTGNTFRNISANINALSAHTTYHFRIVATNSSGTTYGGDRTFTTLTATGLPVVITNPATLIASFSARLNGSVNPHGLTTTVYFQYGTTTSYGLTTAPQSKTGNTYQTVSANIGSLTASTTYHFRIVATNGAGTRYGGDRTFTTLTATGPPVITTNPATNLTSSSAKLNGSLDPHGLTTSVYFQYGTTTSYGHTTPTQSQTGNTYRNIAANISGLSPNTIYHFRIVATNSGGTRFGSDRTFTTP